MATALLARILLRDELLPNFGVVGGDWAVYVLKDESSDVLLDALDDEGRLADKEVEGLREEEAAAAEEDEGLLGTNLSVVLWPASLRLFKGDSRSASEV